MNEASVIVSRPVRPEALVLLFHGVGSTADNLVPLGELAARERAHAMVVSVSAPHPSTPGAGREWFSVIGVTEQGRPDRVRDAMPSFLEVVSMWQAEAGVDASRTTLVGFSQGAIMALEATQVAALSGRVVSLSGRFAQLPRRAPDGVVFRFVHGAVDPVIDPRFSVQSAQTLRALGADATVQLLPGLAHGIDARAARLAMEALA